MKKLQISSIFTIIMLFNLAFEKNIEAMQSKNIVTANNNSNNQLQSKMKNSTVNIIASLFGFTSKPSEYADAQNNDTVITSFDGKERTMHKDAHQLTRVASEIDFYDDDSESSSTTRTLYDPTDQRIIGFTQLSILKMPFFNPIKILTEYENTTDKIIKIKETKECKVFRKNIVSVTTFNHTTQKATGTTTSYYNEKGDLLYKINIQYDENGDAILAIKETYDSQGELSTIIILDPKITEPLRIIDADGKDIKNNQNLNGSTSASDSALNRENWVYENLFGKKTTSA